MKYPSTDTIAALATPPGSGGIGIIKISGPKAFEIAGHIFVAATRSDNPSSPFEHQRLHYGHIIHPLEGPIDEVFVAVMQAPHSYTTEDVVEINCHGGKVVTQTVLDLVIELGARQAQPGEFTRRAFLGGRISLTQAEAVIDLINAKTRKAAQSGLLQLDYGIDRKLRLFQAGLIDGLATIEAYIDFDDDLEEPLSLQPFIRRLVHETLPVIEKLIQSYREGRIIREGLRIVVAGRPNVGKSSLVNLLLNQDRVIVNPAPGTTRDIIEETIAIEGAPFVIADTAGIHTSEDPVENQGIAKTKEAIDRADLVLFVTDGSQPTQAEDKALYQEIKTRPHLIVQNKIDLGEFAAFDTDGFEEAAINSMVKLSALTGKGLDRLKQRLLSTAGVESDPSGSSAMVNLRQRNLLKAANAHLGRAVFHLERGEDYEIVTIELNDALETLGQIIGDDAPPDVLDHIFEKFCIGK